MLRAPTVDQVAAPEASQTNLESCVRTEFCYLFPNRRLFLKKTEKYMKNDVMCIFSLYFLNPSILARRLLFMKDRDCRTL